MDAATVRAMTERASAHRVRSAVIRGLHGTTQSGKTSITVTGAANADIEAELISLGYAVAQSGDEWTIDWSSPGAASNVTSVFPTAADTKKQAANTGVDFINSCVREMITRAASGGSGSAECSTPFDQAVKDALIADGFTATHDGTKWTISW